MEKVMIKFERDGNEFMVIEREGTFYALINGCICCQDEDYETVRSSIIG